MEVLKFTLIQNENFLEISEFLLEGIFRVSVSSAWKYLSEFIQPQKQICDSFQGFWKAVLYFHFKMHIKALHVLQCAFSATKMLLTLNFKSSCRDLFPREDSLKKANGISRFLRDHVRLVWIVSGVFHTVQLRKVQFVPYVCWSFFFNQFNKYK